MSQFQERYRPISLGVDSTAQLASNANLGGFLAKTSGAITVIDSLGVTVVNAVAVTAGIYTPMPFMLSGGGGVPSVVLSGGASGTLGIY